MLISTMNDLPGWDIDEVLGEVFGLTVRSRNVGSQIGASFKSLVGGELKGMTKMLAEGREHATERLIEEATQKGANAIVAFRFDTSELGTTWTEICAYGTAVRATKRPSSTSGKPNVHTSAGSWNSTTRETPPAVAASTTMPCARSVPCGSRW
jgi:uncharacterized protein YbjQ (UPF0145 family)